MKYFYTHTVFCFLLTIILLIFAILSNVEGGQSYWGLGFRQHAENQLIEDYPFSDKDTSFGLNYQYHDLGGYWLINLDYASGIEGTNLIKQVITPAISLVLTENNWRLGIGVQRHHIEQEDGHKYWNDINWQAIGGYKLPLAGVILDLYVFMPFSSFSDIKIKSDYLEYGVSAVFKF